MKLLSCLFCSLLCLVTSIPLMGCTAFQVKTKEGALLYCRSMEFGFRLNSDVLIVPRDQLFTGTAPEGKTGLHWKTKYGYVGMNQSFAKTLISDGMNEKGLVVGCLYLPGYATYETFDANRVDQTMGAWELGSFLLASCATVEEVKSLLPTVLVAQEPLTEDFLLPLHFYVSDATGKIIIIEYVEGKRNIYDHPLGVLTNSPPLPWHMINLSNYVNLSPVNASGLELPQWSISSIGQGSGLLGLPGDYTPPSRFVRATLFSKWAITPATTDEGVCLGFHLLNTFDIFDGIVRDAPTSKSSPPLATTGREMTEWAVVNDQSHLKTYFRSYESLQIEMVDLKKIDFTQPGFRTISLKRTLNVDDVTNKATSLNGS